MDDIFTQCREGNAVAVRLWLDNTENDLNQGDDHGFSPLHWACREGRCNVVDMLIMRGARINVMNRGDDTPLHLASSHGHHDIVTKLIQCKADTNAVNEHGNTPLHYACFWGQEQVAESTAALEQSSRQWRQWGCQNRSLRSCNRERVAATGAGAIGYRQGLGGEEHISTTAPTTTPAHQSVPVGAVPCPALLDNLSWCPDLL
ncbi:UNVERIFIED_CONTAM: hypothetical protein FKN15_068767 [Acipenser sinensis]